MNEPMFRLLRADEIDCRVARVNAYGVQLLLYKDARCDQNVLDETVGAMNWQRHHSRDNANCTVSIWDETKKMWVEKEDTGTESNTEKEKGLASDSFKRACFNWGIGRELYTAPNMFVPAKQCDIKAGTNGKYTCNNRFVCRKIEYENGVIKSVEISIEDWNGKILGRMGFGAKEQDASTSAAEPAAAEESEAQKMNNTALQTIGSERAAALAMELFTVNCSVEAIANHYNVERLADLTEKQHSDVIQWINSKKK